jgi:hypothetical protein
VVGDAGTHPGALRYIHDVETAVALAVPCFFQVKTLALSQLLDALLIRIAQSIAPVAAFAKLPDLTAAMGKLTGGSSLKGATLSSVM